MFKLYLYGEDYELVGCDENFEGLNFSGLGEVKILETLEFVEDLSEILVAKGRIEYNPTMQPKFSEGVDVVVTSDSPEEQIELLTKDKSKLEVVDMLVKLVLEKLEE